MRTINTPALAALAGQDLPVVLLIDMDLTLPLRVSSAGYDITFEGNTYLGRGMCGSVEPVDDSPGENKAMKFTLAGVNLDLVVIALEEPIKDKPVSMRLAVLDPTTHAVLDASPPIWSGTLDRMPIEIDKGTATISVTAEHRGVTYARPKPLRYTDADQQRLHPGDTSLRFVTSQANHPDVWPAASFFAV